MQNSSSASNILLRRIAAFLYDCLLLTALFFIVTAAAIVLNDGQAIEHWSYKLVLVLIAFIFFDGFWRHGGQTLGMRAWRIRLEGMNNEKVRFEQSLKRFLTGLFTFGFCLLYTPLNSKRQALHDKLSDTIIVKDNS